MWAFYTRRNMMCRDIIILGFIVCIVVAHASSCTSDSILYK